MKGGRVSRTDALLGRGYEVAQRVMGEPRRIDERMIAWTDYGEWLDNQKREDRVANENAKARLCGDANVNRLGGPEIRKVSIQLDLDPGLSVAVVVQEGGNELAWIRNYGIAFPSDGSPGLTLAQLSNATRRCRELVKVARELLED